jgi:hypothetical protein
LKEIFEGLQLQEVLARYVALEAESAPAARQYATAYMTAFETGSNTLASQYETVHLDVLANGEAAAGGIRNPQLVERSLALRAWDEQLGQEVGAAVRRLSHTLQEFMLRDRVGRGAEYQRIVRREGLPLLPNSVIRVHKSAAGVADVPWIEDGFMLQTVCANANFHGKPYFDTVAVKVSDGPQPELEYAQLLLLFEAWLPESSEDGVAGSSCSWQPFAFVRWYDKQ